MLSVDEIRWAVRLSAGYVVTANVAYSAAHACARLDVYRPCENGIPFKPCTESPKPTLVFIHGGAWLDHATICYVGENSVPVITLHGDEDLIVPHAQAHSFHDALTRAGAQNELVTLHGAGHAFDADASLAGYPPIFRFLERTGISL